MITVKPESARKSPPIPLRVPDPCTMIIFGASGDLTHRKLVPALYQLAAEQRLPAPFRVIGFARSAKDDDAFRASLRSATAEHAPPQSLEPEIWEKFAAGIGYFKGRYDETGDFAGLKRRLEELEGNQTLPNRIFYLATPPSLYATIISNLRAAGLLHPPGGKPWSHVIIEKPFGHDLESARELNLLVAEALTECQTYRIDHYLGKETVQNILTFRFGNAIFEPLWNRNHIDHVQITAAESIGVGNRGSFYDEAGVLRDFLQNHLLQVLALCAMEQPVSFEADPIRDEKVKILRSLRPLIGSDVSQDVVRAQYRGYHQEKGVSPGTRTPTYMAMKIMIDNWRWQGVPFYLRTGKCLARRLTEVAIHFRSIPLCLFGEDEVCQQIEANVLTLRIQPDEGIALRFACKTPGEDLSVSSVRMDFSYAHAFQEAPPDAYERLLLDCMRSDATLFARRDWAEWAWKFVTPILKAWEADRESPLPVYEPGSAGPAAADKLLQRDGRRWKPLTAPGRV